MPGDSGAIAFSELQAGAETAVAGAAVVVLAANVKRKWAIIQNTGVANVRVGIAAVTATTGIQVIPGMAIILRDPFLYLGPIYAIRESVTSSTVMAQEETTPAGA